MKIDKYLKFLTLMHHKMKMKFTSLRNTAILAILLCFNLSGWGQKAKAHDSICGELAVLKENLATLDAKIDRFYGSLEDSLLKVTDKINATLTKRNEEMADSLLQLKEKLNVINTESATLKTQNASLTSQAESLKSDNAKAWKTIAESTYKNMSIMPATDIDVLIKNADAKTSELLATFKTQSEILNAAQKMLYEGTDKSKYASILENLKKTIDPKFTAQCSLQTKLLTEFELFEEIASELNRIIEKLKTNTSENVRTFEIEKYSYTHELDYYPWLYEIYKKNKSKHTPIGITFE